jgi:hypothetical protein
MFSQARAAGLDMDLLADQMRARKESATAEFQAGRPAETRTFEGDDVESAQSEEPLTEAGAIRTGEGASLR